MPHQSLYTFVAKRIGFIDIWDNFSFAWQIWFPSLILSISNIPYLRGLFYVGHVCMSQLFPILPSWHTIFPRPTPWKVFIKMFGDKEESHLKSHGVWHQFPDPLSSHWKSSVIHFSLKSMSRDRSETTKQLCHEKQTNSIPYLELWTAQNVNLGLHSYPYPVLLPFELSSPDVCTCDHLGSNFKFSVHDLFNVCSQFSSYLSNSHQSRRLENASSMLYSVGFLPLSSQTNGQGSSLSCLSPVPFCSHGYVLGLLFSV